MLKTVSRNNNEIIIAKLLSSNALLRDPANHCVPILDVLDDPIDASKAIMIMPYLRPFDDPEFCTIGEVTDFISQTLEVGQRSSVNTQAEKFNYLPLRSVFYALQSCFTSVSRTLK